MLGTLALAACAELPVYDPILPPLPAASLQADEIAVMPDGARLPVREWLPAGRPRAVILALHGFNDSRDAFELPGPVFARAGIALYAPDQRGFGAAPMRGRWPGSRVLTDDAAALLGWLHQRYPGVRLYAMGESMGGAVLMNLASRPDPPKVAGWILLSPAVWGRRQMGILLSSGLWLVSTTLPGLSVTGGEVHLKVVASDNRAALLRLARDPLTIRRTRFDTLRGLADLMDDAQAAAPHLPPHVLALYGEKDMIVPVKAAARAWEHMPADVRLGLYPSGYHLLLRDKGRMSVIRDILAWIADPSKPLPSGADHWARMWLAWREARNE
jgi:alpha-beta hydrolase superfamily lysophospholipase